MGIRSDFQTESQKDCGHLKLDLTCLRAGIFRRPYLPKSSENTCLQADRPFLFCALPLIIARILRDVRLFSPTRYSDKDLQWLYARNRDAVNCWLTDSRIDLFELCNTGNNIANVVTVLWAKAVLKDHFYLKSRKDLLGDRPAA